MQNTNSPTQIFLFGDQAASVETQAASNWVQFDSATEHHDPTTDWTDHPVEAGQDVTDHAQTKPYRFTIVGSISETPLSILGTPNFPPYGADRILAVYKFFETCAGDVPGTTPQIVEVNTARWGLLTPCGILTYSHDVDARGVVIFTVNLKRIRIATSSTVQIPPLTTSVPGSSTAGNVGSQSLKTPNTSQAAAITQTKSTLAAIVDLAS